MTSNIDSNWHVLSGVRVGANRRDVTGVMLRRTSGPVLLVGGHEQTPNTTMTCSSTVECVDYDLRRWFSYPSLSEPRWACAAASTHDVVVVMGGWNETSGILSSVELLWNKNNDKDKKNASPTWNLASSQLPTPRCMAAAVTLSETAVLILGGRSSLDGPSLADGHVCKIRLNHYAHPELEWLALREPMQIPRSGMAVTALKNNKFVVVGGFDGEDWRRSTEIHEYYESSPEDGTWRAIEPCPEAVRFGSAVAVQYDGKEYCIVAGGSEDGTAGILQCLDVQSEVWIWSRLVYGAPSLEGCTLAIKGNRLFAVGGLGSKGCVHLCHLNEHFFSSLSSTGSDHRKLDPLPSHDPLPSEYGDEDQDPMLPQAEQIHADIRDGDGHDSNLVNVSKQQISNFKGKGSLCFYTGQVDRNTAQPQGVGKLVTDLSSSPDFFYIGQFRNGIDHGIGEIDWRAADWRYVGECRQGNCTGIGSLQSNGMEYFGSFKDGEMCGDGMCKFDRNGRKYVYSGDFESDVAHGLGTLLDFQTGEVIYDGTWKKGLPYGGNVEIHGFSRKDEIVGYGA